MTKPTVEDLCCKFATLQAAFEEEQANIDALQAPNTESVYASGTADALAVDGTQVAIDLGTQDPVITIGVAGTYKIEAQLKLEYNGATITTQTASFKLRRTNNTAADITGSALLIDLPVATTLTHTVGVFNLPTVFYVTANADDVIALFGAVSAALGAGTVEVSAASIIATKIG